MVNNTTIGISKQMKLSLTRLKEHPRETYEDVISKLINLKNKINEQDIKDLKICLDYVTEELEQDVFQKWLIKRFPKLFKGDREQMIIYNRLKRLKMIS